MHMLGAYIWLGAVSICSLCSTGNPGLRGGVTRHPKFSFKAELG